MKAFTRAAADTAPDEDDLADAAEERHDRALYASNMWNNLLGTTIALLGTMTRTSAMDEALIKTIPKKIYQKAMELSKDAWETIQNDPDDLTETYMGFSTVGLMKNVPPEKAAFMFLHAAAFLHAGLTIDGKVKKEDEEYFLEREEFTEEVMPTIEALIKQFESLQKFTDMATSRIQSYLGYVHPIDPAELYEAAAVAESEGVLMCADLRGWFPDYYDHGLKFTHPEEEKGWPRPSYH